MDFPLPAVRLGVRKKPGTIPLHIAPPARKVRPQVCRDAPESPMRCAVPGARDRRRGGRRAAPVVAPGPAGAREVRDVSSAPAQTRQQVRRFVEGMTREERMLVVLKRELYEGDWEEMVADLKARLEGRPYIFKLAHRIADDLERIDRLRRFERRTGADLSEYVTVEP